MRYDGANVVYATAPGSALNSKLFFFSLTSALAGFLFGFDTVVISGAEQKIQSLWQLSDLAHGGAISAALWGTVLGSLVGGIPTDRLGRKTTLIFIGVLYLVSAIWSSVAGDVWSFGIARMIGGVGVGISTVAAPMYISEIAPAKYRGRLAGLFQFNIVLGILIAFVSNALLGDAGVSAWRWMLGVEAIPAVVYTAMAFTLPESPRWLLTRGRRDEAIATLQSVAPEIDRAEAVRRADQISSPDDPVISNRTGVATMGDNDGPYRPPADADVTTPEEGRRRLDDRFWSSKLKYPIAIAFLVAVFNQLSGINAVLYFAPRIFGLTGLGADTARAQSIGIGITNLVFTFAGLYLIDRIGRRTLLVIGSIGYIASLGVCAASFYVGRDDFRTAAAATELRSAIAEGDPATINPARDAFVATLDDASELSEVDADDRDVAKWDGVAQRAFDAAVDRSGSAGIVILVGIFAFIASHAIGQGAVIWVLISEIFPDRHRAAGQSLGSFTHWIFAASLTFAFPIAVGAFAPYVVFGFFAAMMVLQLVWVLAMVPETKGIPLEQIRFGR